MGRREFVALMGPLLAGVSSGLAGDEPGRGRKGGQGKPDAGPAVFHTDIPPYKGNVILCRPTDRSITLSVLSFVPAKIKVNFGRAGRGLDKQSGVVELEPGIPKEIVLDGLESSTAFEYSIVKAESVEPLFQEFSKGTFRTSRAACEAFTFTIIADSHLDENARPELYRTCLLNAAADKPDFHVDLGDTSMTGKHLNRESALKQYEAQRYYLGLMGSTAPLFMVIGNHDGEEMGKHDSDGPDGLAAWSCHQRKKYFPNPTPCDFYGGNSEIHPHAGALQNYYSWQWGDALFVVLDLYWSSKSSRGGKEPWNASLGKAQYDWLAKTLRASKSKFKFVFIHQLIGGLDRGGRGGEEASYLYEWGGHEKDGVENFSTLRPGWEKPIHKLLVETKVNVVFHGHDHFFAHQERDGVIYQLAPQPAHRNFKNHQADEYGYKKGAFLPNSGHLRVHVGGNEVTIDYIRSADEDNMPKQGVINGQSAFKYAIRA